MNNRNQYYNKEDKLPKTIKRKIWVNIIARLNQNEITSRFVFHWRSFALGIGAAIVTFFTIVGINSSIEKIIASQQPEIVKVNKAYQSIISNLENILPVNTMDYNDDIFLDEYLTTRKEELRNIDEAIVDLNQIYIKKDYSKTKHFRLLELYKMKLNVIEEIIGMEEQR